MNDIVGHFLKLVDEHIYFNHDVAFYAHLLGLHPDSLSRRLRNATGKSAKAHINEALYSRAVQLMSSGMKQVEAARKLGFGDAAHFSRFLSSRRAREAADSDE